MMARVDFKYDNKVNLAVNQMRWRPIKMDNFINLVQEPRGIVDGRGRQSVDKSPTDYR